MSQLYEAAKAVRAALKRLNYIDGGDEPDEEDYEIVRVVMNVYSMLQEERKPSILEKRYWDDFIRTFKSAGDK